MKKYDIWIEGYRATGDISDASSVISGIKATSFREACILFSKTEKAKGYGVFDEEELSFWGCRLYDNETDARRIFG